MAINWSPLPIHVVESQEHFGGTPPSKLLNMRITTWNSPIRSSLPCLSWLCLQNHQFTSMQII